MGFALGNLLSAVQTAAPQLDPNGQASPYLAIGAALMNSRTSPATPGVPNTQRVVDPAVSVATVREAGIWGWFKSRPLALAGAAVGILLVVWLILKRKG